MIEVVSWGFDQTIQCLGLSIIKRREGYFPLKRGWGIGAFILSVV